MTSPIAKANAGGAGGGIGAVIGAAITQAIFQTWPALVGDPWETLITLAVAAAVAYAGGWWAAYQARNQLTTAQVVAAARAGELAPALAGATNKSDATAVAAAIAEPSVNAGLVIAGAPVEMLKTEPVVPAAAPGGHSSHMKPVPRKGAK